MELKSFPSDDPLSLRWNVTEEKKIRIYQLIQPEKTTKKCKRLWRNKILFQVLIKFKEKWCDKEIFLCAILDSECRVEVRGHNTINGMPSIPMCLTIFVMIYTFQMCHQKGSILPSFHKEDQLQEWLKQKE